MEEEFDDFMEEVDNESTQTVQDDTPTQNKQEDDDFIPDLLKSKGIEDPSKIKFENESGEIEEVDWNNLSKEDKLGILNNDDDTGLDEAEVELINAIRNSLLSPAEYILYLQRLSVESYLQNQQPTYSVDQYTDDELYVLDLMSKSKDITEQEAVEALEKAKSNEVLFKKQIDAVRNDYKHLESQNQQLMQLQQEQQNQEYYNQFTEQIGNSIINFKEFSGCELNMTDKDMEDIYEFITGLDKAGVNWFYKALNDPPTVVKMAWFVLNGEQMIQDLREYYQKEISNVRKESYNKGKNDANSKVTYKPKDKLKIQDYDDLDSF